MPSLEQMARGYPKDPSLTQPRLAIGGKLDAMAFMFRMMLSRVSDLDQCERDHPVRKQPLLAHDSKHWRATAE
ncbi:MAG: hypothetical protein OES46_04050 [Gammaproteobacteria bacterium]|jgi:hypothetical protein|nr:hypothetical protein [Gammaproteobacteria bacterium]